MLLFGLLPRLQLRLCPLLIVHLGRLLGLLLLVPLLLSGLLLLLLLSLLLVVGLSVFFLCSCCWGWCLFFLCSCSWCFCLCCSFGRSLVFLWGGGGWAGGSPWGCFFFGVGGFDGDILMVFWSGLRSTISSGSYVSHHDCHLSNSSYAFILAENTWQVGMNSDQSSSSSSSSPCWLPCWLGLH